MQSEIFRRLSSVPPLVRVVVTQATRCLIEGQITAAVFDEQISRITREELSPKGLTMLSRELPGGRTLFVIKDSATGAVCDLLTFDAKGVLEPDSADSVRAASASRDFAA